MCLSQDERDAGGQRGARGALGGGGGAGARPPARRARAPAPRRCSKSSRVGSPRRRTFALSVLFCCSGQVALRVQPVGARGPLAAAPLPPPAEEPLLIVDEQRGRVRVRRAGRRGRERRRRRGLIFLRSRRLRCRLERYLK